MLLDPRPADPARYERQVTLHTGVTPEVLAELAAISELGEEDGALPDPVLPPLTATRTFRTVTVQLTPRLSVRRQVEVITSQARPTTTYTQEIQS